MPEVVNRVAPRVAFMVPHLRNRSGWSSLSRGVIRSMCGLVDPYVYVGQHDADAARLSFPDLPVTILPELQQMSLNSERSLPKIVATYLRVMTSAVQVDLVHSLEAYPTGLVGSWLSRRTGAPHIITTAGTYGVVWRESRPDAWAYRRVLREAAFLCPISHGTQAMVQRYFGEFLERTRQQVVLLGSDCCTRVPRGSALNRSQPIVPTVLSVGALKSRKGYHVSLQAFAKVRAKLPSARYWIVGSAENAEYVRRLERLIVQERIEGVQLLGAVSEDELHRRYQEASLFLLTPQLEGLHFEGFGLVYVEAGAHGLPVVGAFTGGVPDAVQDGVTGLLRHPGDIDGIAEDIIRLLTDAELSRRMGQANREWAETLTWERFARQQFAVYQEVWPSPRGL